MGLSRRSRSGLASASLVVPTHVGLSRQTFNAAFQRPKVVPTHVGLSRRLRRARPRRVRRPHARGAEPARELAKTQLDKLGWSTLTTVALALLDHELALVAADALPVQLDALNRQLADFPSTLQKLHDSAYASGKAFADAYVELQ